MKTGIKFVKVHIEIGYGDKAFAVVREEHAEYILRDSFGKHLRLYKGHCYQDYECKKLSR